MKAVLIVNKNDIPIILCPYCKEIIEEIDIDEYVDDNILYMCPNHNETLLCISSRYNDMDKLENGIINNNCTIKLSYDEFINYIKSNNYLNDTNYNYFNNTTGNYYYLVGIMNLKKIVQVKDIPDDFSECETDKNLILNLCNGNGIDINITHFSELPLEIDADHYGPCLYYYGICTECNRESYSYINGD